MRIVYLHGFTSGPRSAKAVALAPIVERAGDTLEAPELNVPSFEHLRVSAMIATVLAMLEGGPDALLVGSSLGGLVALHVQARARAVRAVVLLAPALEAAERWAAFVGGERGIAEWRARGSRRFLHLAHDRELELDSGFLDDLVAHATPPPLRVPAEIVQGLRDASVPADVSRRFAERERTLARLTLVDDDHGLLASLGEIVAAIERAKVRANSA